MSNNENTTKTETKMTEEESLIFVLRRGVRELASLAKGEIGEKRDENVDPETLEPLSDETLRVADEVLVETVQALVATDTQELFVPSLGEDASLAFWATRGEKGNRTIISIEIKKTGALEVSVFNTGAETYFEESVDNVSDAVSLAVKHLFDGDQQAEQAGD